MGKKICFISSIDRVVLLFYEPHIKKLIDNGYQVTVMCNMDEEFIRSHSKLFRCVPITISRGVNPFNLIQHIIIFTKEFLKNKYDFIQYTGPSTGLCVSIAGFLTGTKPRLYCLWGIRYEGFTDVKRLIFKCLEKISCKLATNILIDSPSNKQICVNEKLFPEKKARLILEGSACGVDMAKFDPSRKDEYAGNIRSKYSIGKNEFVIGFLGRLVNDKGISELLISAKKILTKYDNITYLIVGIMEDGDPIDKDLYEWALSQKKIIFTGYTDQPYLYYAAFDIFVFPSYREGYGGGVIQAAAFAVPSVVSNIPPLLDSIENGKYGLIAEVKDESSLTGCIEEFYNNESLRKSMGTEAQKRIIKSFEQEKWLEEYFSYILSIISQGDSRDKGRGKIKS